MGTTTQLSRPMAFHISAAVVAARTSACFSSLASPTASKQEGDTTHGLGMHDFLRTIMYGSLTACKFGIAQLSKH